jgi:hypothetical protein
MSKKPTMKTSWKSSKATAKVAEMDQPRELHRHQSSIQLGNGVQGGGLGGGLGAGMSRRSFIRT